VCIGLDQHSYSTSCPVSTWMGNHLQVSKPSRYVVNSVFDPLGETVKWVSAFLQSNNNKWWWVWISRLAWSEGWRPVGAYSAFIRMNSGDGFAMMTALWTLTSLLLSSCVTQLATLPCGWRSCCQWLSEPDDSRRAASADAADQQGWNIPASCRAGDNRTHQRQTGVDSCHLDRPTWLTL